MLLAVLISCACATSAAAQPRCKVMDPTGTPLNVRSTPQGDIVGALPNGVLVSIVDNAVDANGKPWAYIARYSDGQPIGWVFREFIACY
ncbi:MAG: SH3 domain-containing protein [Roseiarcus sp.]